MTAFSRVTDALQQHGCAVRGSSAQCPAHEDRAPSLSIGKRRDGNGVVLNCHAGCAPEEIVDALGFTMQDLFDEPTAERRDRPQVVAEYPYVDEHGEVLLTVRRMEPGFGGERKTFRQFAADGAPGVSGIRRVLYRLPEVIQQAATGGIVFVVEGEKDADNLVEAGVTATCNIGGAGKWRDEYSLSLRGVSEVIVIADRDDPGRRHAAQVAASLHRTGIPVRVTQPARGKDVSDHLAAGLGSDELVPMNDESSEEPLAVLDEAPAEPDDSDNPTQARLAQLRRALVDSDSLDSIPDPVPLVDGVLFMDSLAWLYGKPGSGKSFVALDWAGCIANGLPWQLRPVSQGPVLYLVAEGVSGIRRRVRAWEEAFRQPMKNVTFLPVAVQLLNGVDRQALLALVAEMHPALVVIDTQARVTVGAEENSNGEMSKVVDAADQIRQATGACVLLVHHAGKNGLDMRGASAFEGAATSVIKVTRDGEFVEVHSDKQKDVEDFETVFLRMTPTGHSVVLTSRSTAPGIQETNRTEEAVLDAMREAFAFTSATAAQIGEVSGLAKSSLYRALTSLTKRAALINIGTEKAARYALPGTRSAP
ncbi:AAA family ATPase [Streptomyces sp. NBC_00878]|uniref:AAA family ATPase n=1 Tax=Streptomyces sp. NBC_00878 TaxID=2975854 RepID=UPI0022551544|nr:AAA family ATPase [Streptomyces sp. NBC_00878]MCX4908061.1 AAA family ATPase [Streptomyces sp. NBC_00878]